MAVCLYQSITSLTKSFGSAAGTLSELGQVRGLAPAAAAVVELDEQALGRSIARSERAVEKAGGAITKVGEAVDSSTFGKMLATFGKVAAVTAGVVGAFNLLRDTLVGMNAKTRDALVLSRQQLQQEFSGQGDISPQVGSILNRMGNQFEAIPLGVRRIHFGTDLARMQGVSPIWFPRRGLDIDTSNWDTPQMGVGFTNVRAWDRYDSWLDQGGGV